jgi:hypothetical protein
LREQYAGLARGAFSLVMARLALNISIASLGRGHHIECKDLHELLEAEDTVREACKNVTRYLEVADTFNGSELVVEYDKGEERVHITQAETPLITTTSGDTALTEPSMQGSEYDTPWDEMKRKVLGWWNDPTGRKLILLGGGIVLVIILYHL